MARVRRALRSTWEHVDVHPDTLVFRAMEAPAESRYEQVGV